MQPESGREKITNILSFKFTLNRLEVSKTVYLKLSHFYFLGIRDCNFESVRIFPV